MDLRYVEEWAQVLDAFAIGGTTPDSVDCLQHV
jgi:hypothetical protein